MHDLATHVRAYEWQLNSFVILLHGLKQKLRRLIVINAEIACGRQ